MKTGTLYVVATPLGNLGDLSFRAAELLRQVPVVAAEDTRRTAALLAHLDARPTVISFHAHSTDRRLEQVLEILREGRDVALVSDAGTPLVSDPGEDLVAAVRAAGLMVVPLPGPSAVTTALSAGGLPADRYLFLGFLPRKGKEREKLLQRAAESPWTVVFFEAANRLGELLADLAVHAGGERQAVMARELTKIYEQFEAGTLDYLGSYVERTPPRGEVTLLLAGNAVPPPPPMEDARKHAASLLAAGVTRKEAAQRIAADLGLSRNEAYRLVTELAP